MDEDYRLKMTAIASASHVLKYKRNNPGSSDDEALRSLSNELDSILRTVDNED